MGPTSAGSAACQRNHWSHPAHIAQKLHTCAAHASHFRRLTPAAAMRPAAADAGAAAGCFRCVSSGTLGSGSCRRRDLSAFCKSSCRVSTAAATCACTPLGLATCIVVVSANVTARQRGIGCMHPMPLAYCQSRCVDVDGTGADNALSAPDRRRQFQVGADSSIASAYCDMWLSGKRGRARAQLKCTALKDPRGRTRSCQALAHSSTL
jgi:hypothetical protein